MTLAKCLTCAVMVLGLASARLPFAQGTDLGTIRGSVTGTVPQSPMPKLSFVISRPILRARQRATRKVRNRCSGLDQAPTRFPSPPEHGN
jgi:hypothetical protein